MYIHGVKLLQTAEYLQGRRYTIQLLNGKLAGNRSGSTFGISDREIIKHCDSDDDNITVLDDLHAQSFPQNNTLRAPFWGTQLADSLWPAAILAYIFIFWELYDWTYNERQEIEWPDSDPLNSTPASPLKPHKFLTGTWDTRNTNHKAT